MAALAHRIEEGLLDGSEIAADEKFSPALSAMTSGSHSLSRFSYLDDEVSANLHPRSAIRQWERSDPLICQQKSPLVAGLEAVETLQSGFVTLDYGFFRSRGITEGSSGGEEGACLDNFHRD